MLPRFLVTLLLAMGMGIVALSSGHPGARPQTAYAVGAVDQQVPAGPIPLIAPTAPAWTGQTFTAGLTGNLDQVDLSLSTLAAGASGNLTVEIRAVSGGLPTSTVLGSGSISAASLPVGLVAATLSATLSPPAPVTAGTQYAIALQAPVTAVPTIWFSDAADPYAGGGFVDTSDNVTWNSSSSVDRGFTTYVSAVPTATPTGTATSTVTPTATATQVLATATLTPTSTGTAVPATATATVTATATATSTVGAQNSPGDDDTDKDGRPKTREQRQQEQNTNRGNRDDVYTEGNVLEVGQDAQGSFVVIGLRDGTMVVRLNCGSQCPTIRPGDYVQVEGVKENESLFYADEVSVSR